MGDTVEEQTIKMKEDLVPVDSVGDGDSVDVMNEADEKRLLRRIDMWSTLGSASIMGLIQDLHLNGTEYSWTNSVFYFGAFTFTWVASYFMVRLPVAKFLVGTLYAWALFIGLTAACKNFGGLMSVRFLLGAAEAAILPGSSLLTGMWYKREEHPLRHGAWFLGTSLGVMCGGLLAYAIAHIQGGIGPWRWLFIIFAIVTTVLATFLLWALPDTPHNARFLSKAQKLQAVNRIRTNKQGFKDTHFKWYQVREAMQDPKVWLPAMIACSLSITNGALNAFNPIILVSFGFSRLQAYLFNIAIGGIHAFFVLSSSYICTKLPNTRCFTLIGVCSISLMGSLIVRLTTGRGVRLFGFLCYFAFVPGLTISLSLIASNTAGFTKKSVSSAMFTVAYCVGNIVGPFTFQLKDAPKYTSGYNGVIGCFVAALVFSVTLLLIIIRENHRRDQAYGAPPEVSGVIENARQLPMLTDETDGENHAFRYVY
ncbi:uncharacterized protein A1O9_05917 [Exophiala aquamarina CBS 119918]|uniref:Major facilitator superfamily (MFS) profile domain-containing protein n=1 Tax=Exophiala aquamarina CBS 119918 TaxID=1182545 RepID=A0A072PD19_9EURO|nr:uncharacterized protein A1O9_05917 [Exophiala aquamarina CBS 119918]KEF57994.1 hypothetical protein A1O9_05917 [Exophiala aquamarina CBS 119918]